MRPRLVALVGATLAGLLLLDLALAGVNAQGSRRCHLGGHLYNRDRQIAEGGIIDAECPLPYPIPWHSAPFGNWGVHSRFGGIRNADQFAGWKYDNQQWQWNSCTTYADYFPPNPEYYNRPPNVGWWQETTRGEERVNSAWFDIGPRGQSCRDRWDGNVYTFHNLQKRLYELDWDGNDQVATLNYGSVPILLDCTNDSVCEGDSGWMDQQWVYPAYSQVSAEAYVLVSTIWR